MSKGIRFLPKVRHISIKYDRFWISNDLKFGANLTHFGPKLDISEKDPIPTVKALLGRNVIAAPPLCEVIYLVTFD